jgi:hypothetical protein
MLAFEGLNLPCALYVLSENAFIFCAIGERRFAALSLNRLLGRKQPSVRALWTKSKEILLLSSYVFSLLPTNA